MAGLEQGLEGKTNFCSALHSPLGHSPTHACTHSFVKSISAQLTVCWRGRLGAEEPEEKACRPLPSTGRQTDTREAVGVGRERVKGSQKGNLMI